jgi:hypothetical protein
VVYYDGKVEKKIEGAVKIRDDHILYLRGFLTWGNFLIKNTQQNRNLKNLSKRVQRQEEQLSVLFQKTA